MDEKKIITYVGLVFQALTAGVADMDSLEGQYFMRLVQGVINRLVANADIKSPQGDISEMEQWVDQHISDMFDTDEEV